MASIGGTVAAGWEPVRDALAANLASGDETGCAVSVYHRGHQVVDLWGGHFDKEQTTPYTDETLQLVFSTTKGITAIAVAMCVEPTGCPEPMYSCTTARRMAVLRSSSMVISSLVPPRPPPLGAKTRHFRRSVRPTTQRY